MGRYDLGLSEEDFWSLTMGELNALITRCKQSKEWLDYRAALICTVMANAWRGKNQRAFSPRDFMPESKPKQQTVEQIWAMVKLLNSAFGGEVVES